MSDHRPLPLPDYPDQFWDLLEKLRTLRAEQALTPTERARRVRARKLHNLGWAEDVQRRREHARATNPPGLERYAPGWPSWADHLTDKQVERRAATEARKKARGQLTFDLDE